MPYGAMEEGDYPKNMNRKENGSLRKSILPMELGHGRLSGNTGRYML